MGELTLERQRERALALGRARARLKAKQQQPDEKGFLAQAGEVASSALDAAEWLGKRQAAMVTGGVEGIPVVGKPAMDALKTGSAHLRSMVHGQPVEQSRAEVEQAHQGLKDDHSFANTAGKVSGAVGGTLGAAAVAPTAMGVGAGGIIGRTAFSTLSGGGIGGTDAYIRSGGDWDATKTGTKWGAGLGFVAPAAGQAIGSGWRHARDWLGNQGLFGFGKELPLKNPQAYSAMKNSMRRDGVNPADVPRMLADKGDEAMVLDLGPNLRDQAGALAATPGKANATLAKALANRSSGANQRITSTVDDALGKAKTPMEVADEIKAAQGQLSPRYSELFATKSRRVDTTDIANHLDSEIVRLRGPAQSALQDVRKMLNVSGSDLLDPNPSTLHQTRIAIDGLTESTENPKVVSALKAVRKQIDTKLRDAVPGIKELDAQWADIARQGKAFEIGQKVLDAGRSTQPPSDLAKVLAKQSTMPGVINGPSGVPVRLREGTRAEIQRILGTTSNDKVALQRLLKGDGSWNREKLAMLYGPERAGRVMDLVDQERLYAESANAVTRNSLSASRIANQNELPSNAGKAFGGPGDRYTYGGSLGPARGAAVDLGRKAVSAVRKGAGEAGDAELALALTADQKSEFVRRLAELRKLGPVSQDTINRLARSVSQVPSVMYGAQ